MQESQQGREIQLQTLLSPFRVVLTSIEPDLHSSVLAYSSVPSSFQFDTQKVYSFTHQIVSVEPVDENGLRLTVSSCVKKLFGRVKIFIVNCMPREP